MGTPRQPRCLPPEGGTGEREAPCPRSRRNLPSTLSFGLVGASRFAATQHEHDMAGASPGRLGTVHFATSCSPDVEKEFDRGVALLHSFWFSASIEVFSGVPQKDPGCAMAHWGIAMSWWGNPFAGFRTPKAIGGGPAAGGTAEA